MKKLLHQKIPTYNGKPIFDWESVQCFHNQLVELIGDRYEILTTPTDIEALEEDDIVVFQNKVISVKELLEKLSDK